MSSSSASSTDEFIESEDHPSMADAYDNIGKLLTALGKAKAILASLPNEFLDEIENDAILYWQVEKRLRKKANSYLWENANPGWPKGKEDRRKGRAQAASEYNPVINPKRIRFSIPTPAIPAPDAPTQLSVPVTGEQTPDGPTPVDKLN
jgi:hypothetical protein